MAVAKIASVLAMLVVSADARLRSASVLALLVMSADALQLRSRATVVKGGLATCIGASLPASLPANAAAPGGGAPKPPPELSTKSGLRYVIDRAGAGPKPQRGQTVLLDYVLRAAVDGKPPLYVAGTKASAAPRPEVFTLGVAASIPGFDEAVMDMQAGEKRIVIVPPNLAYGKQGTEAVGGVIPPDATLIYTLELRDLAPLEPLTAEQKTWMAANPLPWAEAAAPAPAPPAPSAE